MKKIITALLMILVCNASWAAIGYIDYDRVLNNYTLAKTYKQNLKTKTDEIKNYAKQKDAQIKSAKTTEEKQRIQNEGVSQVKLKQNSLKTLIKQYTNEIDSKVGIAAEKVRVQKQLDIIIKKDSRVSGGIDCTQEVINALK